MLLKQTTPRVLHSYILQSADVEVLAPPSTDVFFFKSVEFTV